MAKVVRTEVRRRGLGGKICKWGFIAFNLLMVAIMLQTCATTSKIMAGAHS